MIPALLNNRYRIIQALATGGFGETFLAQDTHMPSGRHCVIKQLKPIANNPNVYQLVQERFEREAAILEQLGEGSTQIPQLYAYFAEQGQFYLVQEWIEGVTLNAKLQRHGLLGESDVKEILLSILPILDYVHNRGIIHRDIKPNNIILRQHDGKPVLIDFGIAKETMGMVVNPQGEITSSIVVGTKGFMPLEQAAGKPVYASDLYSLGLTAIYLLTSKRPQELETNPETGKFVWHTDAVKISPSLAAILDKTTQPHPRDRFSTAREMLLVLQADTPVLKNIPEIIPAEPTLPLSQTKTTQASDLETTKLPTPTEGALDWGVGGQGRLGNTPSYSNSPLPKPQSPIPSQEVLEAKTLYSRQEYRHRQILLNKVKNYWIKGVLETSLHDKALIALGLEKRLDALDRPWGIVWETPEQPRQTLPPNTRIIDQFDQLGAGRTLLILGAPGAGKTTTLLELTRDLISRTEQDLNQSIPVVFNLSAWTNDKQALADWLVQELNTKYQVSQEIGQAWIKTEQILLLLDGLDEVNPNRRAACVQALNEFIQLHGTTEIVVTSRIKDYEVLDHHLRFQAALFIQPLTLEQVHHYLASADLELAALNTSLQADTTLQELAKSPLMLSIMTLAYQGMSVTDLPGMNLEERRQHLFDNYIQRMFDRRGATRQYSKPQSMQWLIWLAQQLSQQSQTVFLIERMQPDLLPKNWQKRIYGLSVVLCFILFGGLIGILVFPLNRMLLLLSATGLAFWRIFGISRIKPVEKLKWSGKNARKNLIRGVVFGSLWGLLLKIPYYLLFNPLPFSLSHPHFRDSLLRGLVFGMTMGLTVGLVRGLTSPGIEMLTVPNQGIWQSAKNAVVFSLIGFCVACVGAALLHWRVLYWGMFGLSFGLLAGGGEACIKHFILRLILYLCGYIPGNYARFLDWATERIFLQKVGGGYIFIHRLLLEHFARMPLLRD
ncbi:protein kinase [Microcoleus sp. FACHB-53]|nr:protein kinase [Microcoleus sp. FACHB-53]